MTAAETSCLEYINREAADMTLVVNEQFQFEKLKACCEVQGIPCDSIEQNSDANDEAMPLVPVDQDDVPEVVIDIEAEEDCKNVIKLAKSVGFSTDEIATLEFHKCCDVLGITCKDGRADIIDWSGMGLKGTIDRKLRKLTVSQFFVQNNELTGEIKGFPSTIKYMSFENNKFTGKLRRFPNFVEAYFNNNGFYDRIPKLPPTAQTFTAANNLLSKRLPKLPANMKHIDVSGNYLSGNRRRIPETMHTFIIAHNSLSGKLPWHLPESLKVFDVSNNYFYGKMPKIPSGIQVLKLRNQRDLTGDVRDLPDTIEYFDCNKCGLSGELSLKRPSFVFAGDNKFSKVTIEDTSAIHICDISNSAIIRDEHAALEGICRMHGTRRLRAH